MRLSVSELDEGSQDFESPPLLLTDKDNRNENEAESCSDMSNMAAPRAKPQQGRTSRNSRKTDLISLEEEMEESLQVSLASRFSSSEEKMLSVLSQQNLASSKPRTVTSETILLVGNTSGECRYPIDKVSVASSSRANGQNILSLENLLDDVLLHPESRDRTVCVSNDSEDDILSLLPAQRERRELLPESVCSEI